MDMQDAYPLIRSVSKTGSFALEIEAAKALAASATNEDAAKLYVLIRDESQREEREWRDEFLDLFPDCEPLLPPLAAVDFDPQSLFELIDLCTPQDTEGYLDAFEDFLAQAEDLNVDLASLEKDGALLRAYAELRGNPAVLQILDEFGVK